MSRLFIKRLLITIF